MRWALWGRLKKTPIQAGSDVLLRCVTFTERLKSPSYDAHQHRYSWIRHEDRRRQVVYVQSKSSGHTWNINILNIIKCFHVSVYNKCLPFIPDLPDLRPLIEQISEGECSRHRAGFILMWHTRKNSFSRFDWCRPRHYCSFIWSIFHAFVLMTEKCIRIHQLTAVQPQRATYP